MVLETTRDIESILHVVRQLFAMNVLSKTQHIQHAESELCFAAMLQRQSFPHGGRVRSSAASPFGSFAKATSAFVLLRGDVCFSV